MLDRNFILYAEDDVHYAALMECVFRQAGLPHRLFQVSNGREVVDYLTAKGKFSNRVANPLPALVLLDLKMPVMDGFEALEWIRNKSEHPLQPVVVLTCSDELRDIKRAYELGANSFLLKPPNVEDLTSMMKTLEHYWLRENKFVPPPPDLKFLQLAPENSLPALNAGASKAPESQSTT